MSASVTQLRDAPEQVALRQLRHHTKNALQRLLCQVSGAPGLQRDPAGRALAHDIERRILLSATVSDALFGLTQAPGPLELRLRSLAQSTIELMSDGDQEIGLTVAVDGLCPAAYDDVVVRVAHELVGNAVKHGMKLRLIGQIEITVDGGLDGVTLSVADDGWGPAACSSRGEGLRIAQLLAGQQGGTLTLAREACRTTATLSLPPRGVVRGFGRADAEAAR